MPRVSFVLRNIRCVVCIIVKGVNITTTILYNVIYVDTHFIYGLFVAGLCLRLCAATGMALKGIQHNNTKFL